MAKNTHLEHLEDDILNNGSSGGKNAIAFLRELGEMLTAKSSQVAITTKWDGSPAIVCGKAPASGRFFVGTKSVFAKTAPKVCYTNADIDAFYPGDGQLNKKLKMCLLHLPKLGIDRIVQGDLLFTDDTSFTNINGKSMITFTNGTDLATKIRTAKMGIVFHTAYSGPSIPELTASFGVDISTFNSTPDVYVVSSSFADASGAANFGSQQKVAFNAAVNRAEGSLRQASKFLDILASTGESKFIMANLFKRYFNTYIVSGRGVNNTRDVATNFAVFYSQILEQEIASKKTKAAQNKYKKMKQDGLKFISANERSIYMTVASYINLQTAKSMVVSQLSRVNTLGTFMKTDTGYRVTAPEGFVAIKDGSALKLVDRLEFSKANFTVAKNWDRG